MTIALPALRINGSNTLAQDLGLRMGEGFLNALTAPLETKDHIFNESRLEHGKRLVLIPSRFKPREIDLDFTLTGSAPEDLRNKQNTFLSIIYEGEITLQIPQVSDEVYHLIYTGKGSEYDLSPTRTFCHMVLKFCESNPARRTEG